jgi:hypothetical protein
MAKSQNDDASVAAVVAVDVDDWGMPRPEIIPRPTFWPAGLAFGITFLMWGLLTSIVLVVVGLTVVTASLVGWIGELRREQQRRS